MQKKIGRNFIIIGLSLLFVSALVTTISTIKGYTSDENYNSLWHYLFHPKDYNPYGSYLPSDRYDLEGYAPFVHLTEYNLEENEEHWAIIDGKELEYKNIDGQIYVNGKKIEANTTKFFETSKVLLFCEVGQYGCSFVVYDLDVNKQESSINKYGPITDLVFDNGKIAVKVRRNDTRWMSGYKIGDLLVAETSVSDCSKHISDYPDIIEEHKDDVLDAEYYLDYVNGEVVIEQGKVLLTVASFAEDLPDACVIED